MRKDFDRWSVRELMDWFGRDAQARQLLHDRKDRIATATGGRRFERFDP
jgi:hypothetical protein